MKIQYLYDLAIQYNLFRIHKHFLLHHHHHCLHYFHHLLTFNVVLQDFSIQKYPVLINYYSNSLLFLNRSLHHLEYSKKTLIVRFIVGVEFFEFCQHLKLIRFPIAYKFPNYQLKWLDSIFSASYHLLFLKSYFHHHLPRQSIAFLAQVNLYFVFNHQVSLFLLFYQ